MSYPRRSDGDENDDFFEPTQAQISQVRQSDRPSGRSWVPSFTFRYLFDQETLEQEIHRHDPDFFGKRQERLQLQLQLKRKREMERRQAEATVTRTITPAASAVSAGGATRIHTTVVIDDDSVPDPRGPRRKPPRIPSSDGEDVVVLSETTRAPPPGLGTERSRSGGLRRSRGDREDPRGDDGDEDHFRPFVEVEKWVAQPPGGRIDRASGLPLPTPKSGKKPSPPEEPASRGANPVVEISVPSEDVVTLDSDDEDDIAGPRRKVTAKAAPAAPSTPATRSSSSRISQQDETIQPRSAPPGTRIRVPTEGARSFEIKPKRHLPGHRELSPAPFIKVTKSPKGSPVTPVLQRPGSSSRAPPRPPSPPPFLPPPAPPSAERASSRPSRSRRRFKELPSTLPPNLVPSESQLEGVQILAGLFRAAPEPPQPLATLVSTVLADQGVSPPVEKGRTKGKGKGRQGPESETKGLRKAATRDPADPFALPDSESDEEERRVILGKQSAREIFRGTKLAASRPTINLGLNTRLILDPVSSISCFFPLFCLCLCFCFCFFSP